MIQNITKREKYLILCEAFTIAFFIGVHLNYNAVVSNGCQMPINTPYPFEEGLHKQVTSSEGVNYYYLTDIIPIKLPNYIIYISIGDVIAFIGLIGNIIFTYKYLKDGTR